MGALRVIAGKARGRKLRAVPGDGTRPITDRTKESLFNILGADLPEASFLDLFAGTGSVGIEALSRGASYVRFLDNNHRAIQTIRANLKSTGLEAGSQVSHMDAFAFLAASPERCYDYVYIAPPQYKELWSRALQDLDSNAGLLSDDAWVIAQIDPVEYKSIHLQTIKEFDQRRYGSTLLVFYEREVSHEAF